MRTYKKQLSTCTNINFNFTYQSMTHQSSFMLFCRIVPVSPIRTVQVKAFIVWVIWDFGFLSLCTSSTMIADHGKLWKTMGNSDSLPPLPKIHSFNELFPMWFPELTSKVEYSVAREKFTQKGKSVFKTLQASFTFFPLCAMLYLQHTGYIYNVHASLVMMKAQKLLNFLVSTKETNFIQN